MSPEVKVEYSVKVSNTNPSDGPSAAKAAAGINDTGDIGTVVRNDGFPCQVTFFRKRCRTLIAGKRLFLQRKLHSGISFDVSLLHSMSTLQDILLFHIEHTAQNAAQCLGRTHNNDFHLLTSFSYSQSHRKLKETI